MYKIVIGLTIDYKSPLYERNETCEQEDTNCYTFYKDNFILDILDQYSTDEKIKKINSLAEHYCIKKMEVINTDNMGFGVKMMENSTFKQPILKFNKKKIISSNNINRKMFFKNTLSKQSEKIKFFNFKHHKLPENYGIHLQHVQSLFYHMSRFNQTFLKDDLVGLPDRNNYFIPFLNMTYHELALIQYQTKVYKLINTAIKGNQKYFNLTRKVLNEKYTPEQFSMLFQRDDLNFQVYTYLNFVLYTRSHTIFDQSYLVPIFHYVNHAQKLTKKDKALLLTRDINNLIIQNSHKEVLIEQEYQYFYGVINVIQLAFIYGFIPEKLPQACEKFKILEEYDLPADYQIDQENCINSQTLAAYSMIGQLLFMNQDQIDNCEQKVGNTMKFESQLELFEWMFMICRDTSIASNVQIYNLVWAKIHERIKTYKQNNDKYYFKTQKYLKFRQNVKKSDKIAKILFDYYTFASNEMTQANKEFIKFLKTNLQDVYAEIKELID